MTRGLIKDFLRDMKKSIGRFLSIFCIVLVGVGFFSGIKSIPEDMRYSIDKYYDDYNMMDIRLLATLGLSDEDIKAISDMDMVESVQAGYSVDAISVAGSSEQVFRVHSLPSSVVSGDETEYINKVKLVDGRMPESADECVIEYSRSLGTHVEIGDTVKLYSGTKDPLSDSLSRDTYKVVGTVITPYYLSFQKGSSDIGAGKVNYYMYVPEENFAYEVYTEALITVKGAKEFNSYSDEYDKYIEKIVSDLENMGTERSDIRLEEIKAEAQKQLDESYAEYNAKKLEYEQGIASGEEELDAALVKLVEGQAKLDNEKALYEEQIKQAEAQIKASEQELKDGEEAYNTALAEYERLKEKYGDIIVGFDSIVQKLNEERAEVELRVIEIEDMLKDSGLPAEDVERLNSLLDIYKQFLSYCDVGLDAINELNNFVQGEYGSAEEQLAAAKKKIDDGKKQLEQAKKELEDGKKKAEREFAAAEKELKNGWDEYYAGKNTLSEAKAEGEKQLNDAFEQLVRAEDEIERISTPSWYVLDRNMHYSFVDYDQNVERLDSIAKIFPVFFYLVAALVCLTTMTRMVDEQRGLIGTYKALGYSNGAIASKFILYSVLASALGGIAGVIIGSQVFPPVIYNAYAIMYTLPELVKTPQIPLMVISVVVGVAVTTLAAFGACRNELKETPALLMRPKSPKAGKKILLEKIPALWRRISFSQKVTIRNIVRYKKRFFMTVIGIAGCSALLLAGFGMNNTISQVVSKQFTEIYKYQTSVNFASDAEREDVDALMDEIKAMPNTEKAFEYISMSTDVYANDKEAVVTLVVADDKGIHDFVELRDRVTQKTITLGDTGIVVSEKLAKELGISIGDSIQVDNGNGVKKRIEVAGITEHYVYHYMYMSPEAYKEVYRIVPETNAAMVKLKETSAQIESNFSSELMQNDSVGSVTSYTGMAESFGDIVKALNSVVIVLIVCAGLLAFVVMYNLTNINIGERIREIATIKVLGFYNREVAMYVYRENLLLSLIGALVGLLLGIALHIFIISSIEQDGIMFGYEIEPISYIYAFLITLGFSFLVNVVMYKRLKNIPMVESLKSVE